MVQLFKSQLSERRHVQHHYHASKARANTTACTGQLTHRQTARNILEAFNQSASTHPAYMRLQAEKQ